MADINKFTSKEVLNKVLLDSSGDAVNAFSHTTQEALNAALNSDRDALKVAKAIVPYSITKRDKLQQIIDHYEKDTPEYRSGGAYRAMLKLFADNIKNENNS